ncbi:phenylalanine--tRNA ligase subunit alpha [Pelolinea submarina]|uniref:Phenylalanine--tRNA ligase alpha subunit n=1 Tax=Pelolinea submarina TaxID=913107 RepID=A0A347ZNG8_9CHLR|nr:phenylalanine--tRNA ligase subunit alpha [Pelolinea submarina]REG08451.1 phenylalanyl-tRNA synthetase alpha subunit [Pelolinea submarina]BBB46849.1 phenylalanyl-tRNA synthetase alpha chain [Pelolinea submarina]
MSEKSSLITELEALQQQAEQELAGLTSESDLQNWRTQFLGRSAMVMQIFRRLPEAPQEERPGIGQFANQVKSALEEKLAEKMDAVKASALQENLSGESLDVTLPGRSPSRGRLHIQTKVTREVCHIFAEMGFQVFQSPEVESDDYNFELLNIPAHHPARDMWDTFFTTEENVVLRTHTSPGQIRSMRAFHPDPIRVVLPGMCYRYEQTDANHEIQFNQLELLVVGKDITFAHLKGTLEEFAKRMFGRDVRTRFRPSYFPFTEPSAEMDVECFVCGGKGCPACGSKGWLEICGCGLTHPVVLKNGGYDPDVYTGFAAGLGIERISMLRYRIDDIRNFWRNDVRFLEQF